MLALYTFEVHTPYRLFFSGRVQAITLMLADGEVGVYANHSRFIAPSVTGILRIKDADDKWRDAFVSDGILEIKEFKSVLMVDAAEWPEEIDKERALEAKKRAEKDLANAVLKFEIEKIKTNLRRAEFRLKVVDSN